ncbi:LamB/YcsF family protein [Yoonia sp. SDW83-1]|uniref:LamB/YcsF family protein n=1 Tax=Yoonia sp. SDW83-1 TaxID=3366945 RepID=UPI00398C6EA3
MRIDLNSDLGGGFGPWSMGDDAGMLSIVSSANVACGGHASDLETMFHTLSLAKENGVNVGAHPGYNDREGFGRRVIPMSPAEIGRLCAAQIGALKGIAAQVGVPITYVKPHGALGNLAARDAEVAAAIVKAALMIDPELAILAISGTHTKQAARAANAPVYSEIFADCGYILSGQLVPRGQDGAMIHDAAEAVARLLSFLETGLMPVIDGPPIKLAAQSICVHGDSPGAVDMAREIRQQLTAHGIQITGFIEA